MTLYASPIPSVMNARRTFDGINAGDSWAARAACSGLGDLMYPDGNGPMRREAEDAARDMCAKCLVINDCRLAALKRDERWGIWGGVNMEDRHERDAARRRAGMPTDHVIEPDACNEAIGTVAGHQRHARAKERPCTACREAFNAYNVRRRAAAKRAACVTTSTQDGAADWYEELARIAGEETAHRIVNNLTAEANERKSA